MDPRHRTSLPDRAGRVLERVLRRAADRPVVGAAATPLRGQPCRSSTGHDRIRPRHRYGPAAGRVRTLGVRDSCRGIRSLETSARRQPVPSPCRPNLIPTLWTAYVIGLLGRAASYFTGTTSSAGEIQAENPFLQFVALMAAMGTLGLIIFIRPANGRVTVAVISALTAMELVWSVVTQSKTPILGAAFAIAVRFALIGWTRIRAAAVIAIALIGIGAFGWLQSFKGSYTARAQAHILDSYYPSAIQPFLSILRRFDLLAAATDSYYMGGRPWLSPGEVVQNAMLSLLPSQLLETPKFRSGIAWASEVRGASVDMTGVSVSLAEGNINEGFVLGGYPGVIVGVVFTFVLLLAAVRALHSRNMVVLVSGPGIN